MFTEFYISASFWRVFSEFLAKLRFVARIVDNNVAKMHNSGVLKFNLVWSKKYGYK